LESEIQRAKRFKRVFSLVMFDIDQFKDINDTLGHDAGDEILKMLTGALAKHVRTTDTFARWGGDEFAVLVVETPVDGATVLAGKLKKEIEITNFPFEKVACSFGVTEFQETDDLASIIKRVDKALYEAKNSGKNRICVR
ncbi:MAG: GGDEF domain-containing protein, partial [Deltaproteobacteria bacterium]